MVGCGAFNFRYDLHSNGHLPVESTIFRDINRIMAVDYRDIDVVSGRLIYYPSPHFV